MADVIHLLATFQGADPQFIGHAVNKSLFA